MVEVRNLTKKYGDNLAVDGISFTIEKGKIYGFLGPNGAGKSTTMNIIAGCLAATSGTVKVNGHDVFEEPVAAKKAVGYLPEQPPLYFDMTPYEYLDFVADAKKIKRADKFGSIEKIMTATGIVEVANRLIRNLSKGYRQRVGIAQAMLGDPEVIILDEPTVGLDPKQIVEIRGLIRSLGRDHTVILSSHILSEVQEVCDDVIVISRGKIVASDSIENLSSGKTAYRTVEMEIAAPPDACFEIIDSNELISHFAVTEGGAGTRAELTIPAEYDLREWLFNAFSKAGLPVLELHTVTPSLESVYLKLTEAPDAPDEKSAAGRKKSRKKEGK